MPVSWTSENDRKLLLLMLKSTDAKVNYDAVQKMWGADPPTVKAISLRIAALKKLAKQGEVSSSPSKKTSRAGLVTPVTSPKSPAKRPRDEDGNVETTPRRGPKRGARRVIKYQDSEPSSDEDSDWVEEANEIGSEKESDEEKDSMKEADEEEDRKEEDCKEDINADDEFSLGSPLMFAIEAGV